MLAKKEIRLKHLLSQQPGPETTPQIEEQWATIDGARMRYLRAGSGPALVLLHGLLGYSFSWRFTMPALARHATVWALDQLGTGYSDRPPSLDCSLRAMAERLLRFLDHVGVSCFDLLGTSHGGAVAIMAASLSPQRVRRLILVAPVNPWSARGRVLVAVLSSRTVAPLFLWLSPHLKVTHNLFLRRMYGNPQRIPPGTLEGYAAPFRIPGAFHYSMNVLRTWTRDVEELKLALPKISHIPTLFIWGGMDTAVNPASATDLRKQFADSSLRLLEGAGHLPYEEVPEDFNRIVVEFLRRGQTE